MGVNLSLLFHYFIPLALCLGGFHSVFYHSHLGRKAAGWCLFQAGLAAFLFEIAPAGSALPRVLLLLVFASTLVVGLFLAALCLKIEKKFKTLDDGEIGKRGSK
jgi:hypothetical protein